VVSVSLCIARNTPKIMADWRDAKAGVREQSLRAFHHRAEGELPGESPDAAARRLGEVLASAGWQVRLQAREQGQMLAARKGRANKLGYLAAHGAIVLVCVGGLLDGDLMVRAQMWWGGKLPYTGGGLIAEVPEQHKLSMRNPTFRGNLLVAEGQQSHWAILNQSDGIVLQELPFSIELKRFIVEHYSTGMPKLFASEILIHDRISGAVVPARVEVNHPARHRGIEIYQSSFDDGGSRVVLEALPLDGRGRRFTVEGHIGGSTRLTRGPGEDAEKKTLEFAALRVINVENMTAAGGLARSGVDARAVDLRGPLAALDARLGAANKTVTHRELRNIGPSITYRLRDAAGQAREFHNYMLPVDLGDGPVFLLGMRETPAENFRYLRIPADDQGEPDGFLRLRAALVDPKAREVAVNRYVRSATDPARPDQAEKLRGSALAALAMFAGDGTPTGPDGRPLAGLQAIGEFLEARVPEAERERTGEVLIRVLNGVLFELAQMAREQAGLRPLEPGDATHAFMTQAVLALGDIHLYPAPMAFRLREFDQVQASVFQVARAPGRNIVYLGCLLLIVGIFAMLYVRERRLWVWVGPRDGGGSQALMALSSNRRTLDTDREFDQLKTLLQPR